MNKSRQMIIAGNWKMHGSKATVSSLLETLKQEFTENPAATMIVFPPFVYLEQTEKILKGSKIRWGAQNIAVEKEGAYTGEVSASMLADFGCQYVLIGHSERRSMYNEDPAILAQKFLMAQAQGLQPILCLGETLEHRKNNLTEEIVCTQLMQILDLVGGAKALENAIIAYEPIWAIGTGLTATANQAQEVHAVLRQQISRQDPSIAEHLSILYGGSVKANSAKMLFEMPDIDGALVGGASLDAQEFLKIYQAVGDSR